MARTCLAHWSGECTCWLALLKGRDLVQDLGVNGSIRLRNIKVVKCDALDWINLSLDMDRWRIFVSTLDESAGSVETGHVLTS